MDNIISVKKISDTQIEVITQVPPVTNVYDYDYLTSQRDYLQQQLDDYIADTQAKISNFNALIGKADEVSVVSAVELKKSLLTKVQDSNERPN